MPLRREASILEPSKPFTQFRGQAHAYDQSLLFDDDITLGGLHGRRCPLIRNANQSIEGITLSYTLKLDSALAIHPTDIAPGVPHCTAMHDTARSFRF